MELRGGSTAHLKIALRHTEIECAILIADVWINDPNFHELRNERDPLILSELELPHESRTENESCNSPLNTVFWPAIW